MILSTMRSMTPGLLLPRKVNTFFTRFVSSIRSFGVLSRRINSPIEKAPDVNA